MLSKILDTIKFSSGYTGALVIIGVAIFTLLYDGPRYRKKGYIKEVRAIKLISYSYIVIGIIMYILLLMR